MLAYDLMETSGRRWTAEYNTDTLRFEVDGIRLAPSHSLGIRATGEAFMAQLSGDYFQMGDARPERGFKASFLQAQIWVHSRLGRGWFAQSELGARRWILQAKDETSPDFYLARRRLGDRTSPSTRILGPGR